jgi:hypothetical protein
MPKRKKLFSVETSDQKINMNVDDTLFEHFKTLTPLEQKRVLNLMTLKLFQLINE